MYITFKIIKQCTILISKYWELMRRENTVHELDPGLYLTANFSSPYSRTFTRHTKASFLITSLFLQWTIVFPNRGNRSFYKRTMIRFNVFNYWYQFFVFPYTLIKDGWSYKIQECCSIKLCNVKKMAWL